MIDEGKILFVTDEQSYFLFKDLCEKTSIKRHIIKLPKNKILSYMMKIHTNKRIGKTIWFPCRDMWFDKKSILDKLDDDGILMINSRPMTLPTNDFWHEIKAKRPHAKFVLILVDSIHVKGGHMLEAVRRIHDFSWDKILSYDKYDCQEFGFEYLGFNYYSDYSHIRCSGEASDLYYISSIKSGKDGYLREIDEKCREYGVNHLFKLYSLWRKVDYGRCVRTLLPYEQIVSDIMATNCILEILQTGQQVQSIRYLEAVTYNKKILSNNPNLANLPYYNQRFMKYFSRIEDIDWEWVVRKEFVNYAYKGDFSSSGILDLIGSIAI